MIELNIDKEKACAVTGHRNLKSDFDIQKLEQVFLQLIKEGFSTFLVGMALGFDTQCFLTLEKLKKENAIKIIACIPCESQPSKFSVSQKKLYYQMIENADEKVILSREYTPYCMMKRNMFMVDNCCCLVSYLRENSGGTKNTVEYAKKQGIRNIEI